jgi:hypothetical protein
MPDRNAVIGGLPSSEIPTPTARNTAFGLAFARVTKWQNGAKTAKFNQYLVDNWGETAICGYFLLTRTGQNPDPMENKNQRGQSIRAVQKATSYRLQEFR